MNRRKSVVTVKGKAPAKKPKLGSGARFRALESKLSVRAGKKKR